MTAKEKHYALGTYSIAGSPPFAGLLVEDRVIAIHCLNSFQQELGGKLYGTGSMLELLDDWNHNLPMIRNAARALRNNDKLGSALADITVPVDSLRIHAPIENPKQIFMSRANYRTHVIEVSVANGMGEGDTVEERTASVTEMIDKIATEGEPFFFAKMLSSITGPYDDINIAGTTQKLDWELELAVIIGKPARNVSRENAMDYVAGYCMANDLSNRDVLFRNDLGTQLDWMSCKCSPGYMPLGPYIVPADAIDDPHNLSIKLNLNETTMQDERTNDMLHDIPRLIEYASKHNQLLPGDIISTGSPTGNGMQAGVFVKSGDFIASTITDLGDMKNNFVDPV